MLRRMSVVVGADVGGATFEVRRTDAEIDRAATRRSRHRKALHDDRPCQETRDQRADDPLWPWRELVHAAHGTPALLSSQGHRTGSQAKTRSLLQNSHAAVPAVSQRLSDERRRLEAKIYDLAVDFEEARGQIARLRCLKCTAIKSARNFNQIHIRMFVLTAGPRRNRMRTMSTL